MVTSTKEAATPAEQAVHQVVTIVKRVITPLENLIMTIEEDMPPLEAVDIRNTPLVKAFRTPVTPTETVAPVKKVLTPVIT